MSVVAAGRAAGASTDTGFGSGDEHGSGARLPRRAQIDDPTSWDHFESGRIDRQVGCFDRGPHLDVGLEPELADCGWSDFRDKGNLPVDVDTDAITKQVCPADTPVPHVAWASIWSASVQADGARLNCDADLAADSLSGGDASTRVELDGVVVPGSSEKVQTDKVRDIAGPWLRADRSHWTFLRDVTAFQDDETVCERDGVEQLVGDEHSGPRERRQLSMEIAAELSSGSDVECGEGLIEKEEARLDDEGACERNPLLFAAREVARSCVPAIAKPDPLEPFLGATAGFATWHVSAAEPERDVLEHAQMGKEQVVLKDDPDRTTLRNHVAAGRRFVDDVAVDDDLTLVKSDETCDSTQQGGFARTIGSEDRDRLVVGGAEPRIELQVAELELDRGVNAHEARRTSGRAARPAR